MRCRSNPCRLLLTGLSLCLALCLTSWSNADDSPPQEKFEALERDVSAFEDRITAYQLKKAEMVFNLSVGKRAEDKVLADKDLRASGYLDWMVAGTIGQAQDTANKLPGLAEKLQQAVKAWSEEVEQARTLQEDICANAKKINGSPAPSASDISQWINQADRSIDSSHTSLQSKRSALNTAWNALDDSTQRLIGLWSSIEHLLARAPAIEAAYLRLEEHATSLKAAQKDLAKAREQRGELVTELKQLRADSVNLRGQLQYLRLLNQSSPQLVKQIDDALKRMESASLPEEPRAIYGISSQSEKIISQSEQVNAKIVIKVLDSARSLTPELKSAISSAQAALKQATGAQAGFGGFRKGRDCLAVLRKAAPGGDSQDPALAETDSLQNRLEDAQRRSMLLAHRVSEVSERISEYQRTVATAKLKYDTLVILRTMLQPRFGGLDPDTLIGELELSLTNLTQQTELFEEKAQLLEDATDNAKEAKQQACYRAEKAKSENPPSASQVASWHQQSRDRTVQVKQEVKNARDQVLEQSKILGQKIDDTTEIKDGLTKMKEDIHVWSKAHEQIGMELPGVLETLQNADSLMPDIEKEARATLAQKQTVLEELKAIQAAAAELGAKTTDPDIQADLANIRKMAARLIIRCSDNQVPGWGVKHGINLESIPKDIKAANDIVSTTKRDIGFCEGAVEQAEPVLERARSARFGAGLAAGAAGNYMIEANSCVGVLARGPEAAQPTGETSARQALDKCDFDRAESLINAMPYNQTRDDLYQQLTDYRTQDTETRSKLAKARALYDDCKYNQSLQILNLAGQNARCKHTKQAIDDLKRSAVADGRILQQARLLVGRQAKEKFKACELQQSMDLLVQALGMVKCENHKKEIKKSIARVKAAQEAETNLLPLLEQAKAQYLDCQYQKSIETLQQARQFAKCDAYEEKVDRMGRKATAKQTHEETTIDLFTKAKKLMGDGKYSEAKGCLQRAKTHTKCAKYEDDLARWIAKADAGINSGGSGDGGDSGGNGDSGGSGTSSGSGTSGGSGDGGGSGSGDGGGSGDGQEQPAQGKPKTCQEYEQLIQAQADKVSGLLDKLIALTESRADRSETGPAACAVTDADALLIAMRKDARNQLGCSPAVKSALSLNNSGAIGLRCWRWRQDQNSGDGWNSRQTGCDKWKSRVTAAEGVLRAKSDAYIKAHHERERLGTPESFANAKQAICEKYRADLTLFRLVTKAKAAGCNVSDKSSANFRRLATEPRWGWQCTE